MRSIEDKMCYNQGETDEIKNFEFHKANNGTNRSLNHHRTPLGKPTPSKWDDAQKWLVGLSRGANEPRNSNADDRRLIGSNSQREQIEETKKVNCDEPSSTFWKINKNVENSNSNSGSGLRSVCVRDTGTEMTPNASKEPSRTATPVRTAAPVARNPTATGSSTRSPIASGSSTPARIEVEGHDQTYPTKSTATESKGICDMEVKTEENTNSDRGGTLNPLEAKAMAWDEAERAKYTARFKREEVKIQAWENHEKRKAEIEMKKIELKAERIKSRAQEKFANKIASTRRIAEEKRANAEAKLNEKAVKTSERADYIKKIGHLPSSFSFRLPSCCW